MSSLAFVSALLVLAAAGGSGCAEAVQPPLRPTPRAAPEGQVQEERADAPLPAGALARCGTRLLAVEGVVLATHVSDAGELTTIEAVGRRLSLRDPGRARAIAHLGEGDLAALSGDGSRAFWVDASGEAGSVVVHAADARSGERLWQTPIPGATGPGEGPSMHLLASRSGERVTVLHAGQARLLDGRTGRLTESVPLPGGPLLATDGESRRVLFAPEGAGEPSLVVHAFDEDKTVGRIDREGSAQWGSWVFGDDGRTVLLATPSALFSVPATGGALTERARFGVSLRVDAEAPEIATSPGGRFALIDVGPKTFVVSIPGGAARPVLPSDGVRRIESTRARFALSASGRIATEVRGPRIILDGAPFTAPPAHHDPPTQLGWLASGAQLASLGSDGLRLWDGGTCRHLAARADAAGPLATARDGARIAVGQRDGSLVVLDAALGVVARVRGDRPIVSAALDGRGDHLWVAQAAKGPAAGAVKQSPDLVLPPGDGVVRIHLATRATTPVPHSEGADSVSVDASGAHLLLGDQGSFHVQDAATSTPGEPWSPFERARMDPDGVVLLGRQQPEGRLVLAATPSERWRLARNVPGGGPAFDVSRRSGRLAVARSREVRIFDTERGRLLGALEGRTTRSLAFSPDGSRLAVGGEDFLIRDPSVLLAPEPRDLQVQPLDGVEGVRDLADAYQGDFFAVVKGRAGTIRPRAGGTFEPSFGSAVSRLAGSSRASCAIERDQITCRGSSGVGLFFFLDARGPAGLPRSVALPTPARPIEVASSDSFACALDVSSTATCLGALSHAHTPLTKPTRVGGDVAAIALGQGHACLLRKDGRVACWGDNDSGQAGPAPEGVIRAPTIVPGIEDATGITAGGRHSCALTRGGEVWCWGESAYDACGLRSSSSPSNGPARVDGIDQVFSISAGRRATCARRTDGTPHCWGHVASTSFYGPTSLEDVLGRVTELRLVGDSVCATGPDELRCVVPADR